MFPGVRGNNNTEKIEMQDKNNRNQRPATAQERKEFDPYGMIRNAEALQRVVKHLDEASLESSDSDPLLFGGRVLAGPILLTLAVEIALKALLCQEQKKEPPRTHDLLELFNALEPTTRRALEAPMPGWTAFDIFPKESPYTHGSLPEVLWSCRIPDKSRRSGYTDAHTYWRYIHENRWGNCRTGELGQALTLIVRRYYTTWLNSGV